ncbi:MAG: SLC13 family permease, partial [Candidatus Thorarchaeota archaeon]
LRTFLLFVWIVSLVLPRTTTMTIMVPITIQICRALNIDFKPFLISQSLVCNIGSIPSVVADAPNIIITDETGLNAGFLFVSFMPLSFILLIVTWFSILYLFRGSFDVTDQDNIELLRGLNPTTMIKSKQDFYASILAFGVMIAGFILGPSLRIESAMVALFAAAVLLIVAHERAGEFMSKVGWNTVFFLIGVFGLVEGLKAVGLIEELGTALETVIGNSIVTVIILMVWVPACLSPILSNDPVAVVFAPLALKFIPLTPFVPLALILGINLAGNLFTPLGSPANMVVMEYSEKEGNPVTLADFAKIGTITGLINLTIGSLWLLMLSSLLV